MVPQYFQASSPQLNPFGQEIQSIPQSVAGNGCSNDRGNNL